MGRKGPCTEFWFGKGTYIIDDVSRNEATEITRRTQRNLEFIKSEFDRMGEYSQVHLVTQLVNSLLGIVALPREQYLDVRNDTTDLKGLIEQG